MAVALQFSLIPSEVRFYEKTKVFSLIKIGDTFTIPAGKPAKFMVVNGWLGPKGSVIHNRVRILNPSGQPVFDNTEEEVTKTEVLVHVLKGDFELTEEGWHLVQVYNGTQLYIEYQIQFRRR